MGISAISSANSSMSSITSGSSSGSSSEQIKLLQQQKANLEKKLESTQDEKVKKQIQVQIKNLEAQILQAEENSSESGSAGSSQQKPSGPPPSGAAGVLQSSVSKDEIEGTVVDIKI